MSKFEVWKNECYGNTHQVIFVGNTEAEAKSYIYGAIEYNSLLNEEDFSIVEIEKDEEVNAASEPFSEMRKALEEALTKLEMAHFSVGEADALADDDWIEEQRKRFQFKNSEKI